MTPKTTGENPSRGRYHPNSNYELAFIREVVQAVEEGLSQKHAAVRYDVSVNTIYSWMSKHGSSVYQANKKRSTPTKLKRSAVRAVCSGTMTVTEAASAYGVTDYTIKAWSKEFLQENNELVLTNNDPLKKQKIKTGKDATPADVRALQQQLADAQLKIAALNTLIDVAEEQLKINIRKKPGARLS